MPSSVMLIFNDDGTVTWRPAGANPMSNRGSSSSGGGSRYNWIDDDECPIHGPWKVIPGGYSEKKQANYDAFYVCKDNDCINRPGRDWTKSHPAGDDDLPF